MCVVCFINTVVDMTSTVIVCKTCKQALQRVEEVPQNMYCISSATENVMMWVPQKILIYTFSATLGWCLGIFLGTSFTLFYISLHYDSFRPHIWYATFVKVNISCFVTKILGMGLIKATIIQWFSTNMTNISSTRRSRTNNILGMT